MSEIIGDRTAGQHGARQHTRVLRRESIRIVAEPLCIVALKLDREIGGTAIVLRIEAVWFAAGGGADLNRVDIDAVETVDDGLAGRTRTWPGEDEHPA